MLDLELIKFQNEVLGYLHDLEGLTFEEWKDCVYDHVGWILENTMIVDIKEGENNVTFSLSDDYPSMSCIVPKNCLMQKVKSIFEQFKTVEVLL